LTEIHALDPERVSRVATALGPRPGGPDNWLCVASADVARVSGAGVVLIMHGRTLGTVCASDRRAEAVEEVQFMLGEGPCTDAFRTRQPVLVADLAADAPGRWPGFRERALEAGIHAAFGFPIMVGRVCIGALNLYGDRTGALSDEQVADAVAVAHVAGRQVLEWQSVAGVGSLARQLEHLPLNRAIVHQATGMVAVQASVSLGDAVTLLRAYAFSTDRPVADVAADVVGRELRFDDDPPGG
jgi:GAF domain-containing protein